MKRVVAGIACFVVALLAILLARDTWHAEQALHDGDTRANVAAVSPSTWEADALLPGDFARRLLGLDDDIEYRTLVLRAHRLVGDPARSAAQARDRARVEVALRRLETEAAGPRAADAAVLLGVLVFSDLSDPNRDVETPTSKAAQHFRAAAQLDPRNAVAKHDLELMLRQGRSESPRGGGAPAGGNEAGAGEAGLAPAGRGY